MPSPIDGREEVESQDVHLRAMRGGGLEVLAAHLGAVTGADARVPAEAVSPPLHDLRVVGHNVLAILAVSAHDWGGAC